MKKAGRLGFAVALAIGCLLEVLNGPAAHAADKKEVVRQARAAYYNLRSQGLVRFQASIVPNWAPILEPLRNSSGPEAVQRAAKLLAGLHFAMTLDSSDKVSVTHSADVQAENSEMAKGFEQIFSGMEQAVSGFFQTWTPFMLSSMFPEVESDYQLEDLGDMYRLSYKEGEADVVLTMGRNFVMSEAKITSPKFQSTIRPEFTGTSKGFVLSGYTADYQSTSGAENVKLKIKIENREVNALQLPGTLKVDTVYNGSSNKIELEFTDYQVQKK